MNNVPFTTSRVTRYNGAIGHEVFVNGFRVGEVHRYDRGRWAWAVSAHGKYGNGTDARTMAQAAQTVANIAGR